MAARHDPALAERGGPIWARKAFSDPALTELLNGLASAEEQGLSPDEAAKVEHVLQQLANAASAVPDSPWWGRTVSHFVEGLQKNFAQWAQADTALGRRNCLRRMQRTRKKLARRLRRNGHILDAELDLALTRSLFGYLDQLARAMPDVFRGLGMAIGRIIRVLDEH